MEKVRQDNRIIEQARQLKSTAEKMEEETLNKRESHLNSVKAQVEAYKMQNEWEKAGQLLKELADEMKTVDDNWNYAYYSQNQKNYQDAEAYYKRTLEILEKQDATQSDEYSYQTAPVKHNLALLYSNTQRFSEAEAMFKEVLDIYRRIAASYPAAYEPDVALTLNNLALLYSNTQRFGESEAMYKEALEIRRRIAAFYPAAYEPDVAQTQYNVGLLKFQQDQYEEAVPPFEEALEIYRRISKVNSAKQQLYEGSLYWLSRLFQNLKYNDSIYRVNQEWLPIIKQKYESNPEGLHNYYARALGNHSFSAIFMKRYAEAEQYAIEGLAVDSTRHWIASNLAAAQLFQGKYAEAEKIYLQYKEELKEGFLDDFKQFAEAGVIPKEYEADVEKIKRILNE